MLTATIPRRPTSFLARFTNDTWPWCRYPIVGTSATRTPARCHSRLIRCIPATDLTILIFQECRRRGNETPFNLSDGGYIVREAQSTSTLRFLRAPRLCVKARLVLSRYVSLRLERRF